MTHRLLTWMIVANGLSVVGNALFVSYNIWSFVVWRRKYMRILASLHESQWMVSNLVARLTPKEDQ